MRAPPGGRPAVKVLHTSDWHVGRTIRGRSRVDEHRAVLAEIAGVAADEAVDLVLVVGDLFDSAAPTPESEDVVYRALLDLAATGAAVVVVAGNHDNPNRLQAVAPLLELGRVVCRPSFLRAEDGGVVEVESRDGSERALVAVLPFLSQRWVVKADELMAADAFQHGQRYDERVRRLVAALTAGFGPSTVNLVAAHLTAGGGRLGGGERAAHTVFEYEVGALAFPPTASYVALGHLHRRQQIGGPCPIHYCGSALQLDFGEEADEKAVIVVEAAPGRPAVVRDVPLRSGRRLRTVAGALGELRSLAGTTGDDHLRVVVREVPRMGLADDVRDLFPGCVDVVVERPGGDGGDERAAPPSRSGRSPAELFRAYLEERGEPAPALTSLTALFAELLEEAEA